METYWTDENHNPIALSEGQQPGEGWVQWDSMQEAIDAQAIQAALFIQGRMNELTTETQNLTFEQRFARLERAVFGV